MVCVAALTAGCCAPDAPEVQLVDLAIACNAVMEEELDGRELRAALDAETAALRGRLQGLRGREAALEVFRAFFEERGFAYRTEEFPRDATIAAALIRRKGNCQAASLLYFVAAKELSLPVALVLQPGHVHLRWYNAPFFDIDPVAKEPLLEQGFHEKRMRMSQMDMRALGYGRALTDRQAAGYIKAQLAHAYYVRGRLDECLRTLEGAMLLWPGHADFIIDRCIVLESVPARRREAREGYERLRRQWPGGEMEAAAIRGLARMEAVEGNHREALSLLEDAMKTAPPYYKRAVALPMGWALMSLLRYDEALRVFRGGDMSEDEETIAALYGGDVEKALELAASASGWRGTLALAMALAASGRSGEAFDMATGVERPDEYADEYGLRLSAALLVCGRTAEALSALERALDESPGGRVLAYVDGFVWPPDFREVIDGRRRRIIAGSVAASR